MGETPSDLHELATEFGENDLDGEARVGKREVKQEIPRVMLRTQDAIKDM